MARGVCVWLAGLGCLVTVLIVGVSAAAGRGYESSTSVSNTGQNPFLGVWTDVDTPGDGSNLTLTINGGQGSVDVVMHDDYATTCAKAGATNDDASITGTGTIEGTTLTYAMSRIDCLNSISFPIPPADDSPIAVVYDAATDTMKESDLTSPWTRVASPASATVAPVFIVSPTASATTTTPAIDVTPTPSPANATATPTFVVTPIGSPKAGKRFSIAVSVDVLRPPTVQPDSLTCSARAGRASVRTSIVDGAAERICTLIVPKGSRGKTLELLVKPTYGTFTASRTVSSKIK